MTRKGLFITYEGIGPTIFDSQVALHAREMRKHGIELEIWAIETWPGMFGKSRARLDTARELSQSNVHLFRGLFFYIPGSEIINALLLVHYLRRLSPGVDFIHARADYCTAVCGLAGLLVPIPIIWDCRGDSEAEFKTAYRPRNILGHLFKFTYLHLIKWRTSFASRICTRAIFVSEELQERMWGRAQRKPSEIIPTSVSREKFFYEEELRQTVRSRLGLRADQRVLLYSGGMVGYQHFAEYVRVFGSLIQYDSNVHFLVVTPHLERASRMLAPLPPENYTLLSATLDEMNGYYNAADFGILLRERNAVNDVASPTKFGEYCLTGLPVIMNDSVKQSFRFALEFGNLIPYDEDFFADDLKIRDSTERMLISHKSGQALSRESIWVKYSRVYGC